MTWRRTRMIEDRQMRDAARALVAADVRNLRGDLSARGLRDRAADRVTSGAAVVYDEAIDAAREHKGVVAAIVAALALWFARHPILAALGLRSDDEAEDENSDD